MLREVKVGSTVKATYTWLADGSKLRVRDASGNGFDYLGSLTYTGSGTTLTLESAAFPGGVIRSTGSGAPASQEINYFLTDHLGSVRVIVDAAGNVKERNNYYAFGAKHIRSDYPQSDNRYDYNGKEEQTTGNLKFLDYGARMYDTRIGRWFNVDPLGEDYSPLSPFHFSGNNPVRFVDLNGAMYTHYVDEDYNILLQTNDGSDAVVMVPNDYKDIMRYYASNYNDWKFWLDDLKWNQDWFVQGFTLADRQFSAAELGAMNMQTSNWSRNMAAAYLLKPTLENQLAYGFSEVLSQWTNPEKLALAASMGVTGLKALDAARNAAKTGASLVDDVAFQAKSWLGKDARAITNKAGDNVFMSKDGLRRLRFDMKNPHGDSPHIHIEEFINGKWKDAVRGTHRIYPKP